VDVLHYAIEELGHSQAELADILGARASEVLGRRPPYLGDDPKDQCKLEYPRPISSCSPTGSPQLPLEAVKRFRVTR